MRFALVDGSLCLKAYEQFSTQAVFCGGAPPTEKLAEHIRAYCARHLAGAMPAAVSIGFPSTINRARTVVVQTPNIAGIPDDYAVVQELGGALALGWFSNVPLWGGIFLVLFLEWGLSAMWFGLHVALRRDTRSLNRKLSEYQKRGPES